MGLEAQVVKVKGNVYTEDGYIIHNETKGIIVENLINNKSKVKFEQLNNLECIINNTDLIYE